MSTFHHHGCVAVVTDAQEPAGIDWPSQVDDVTAACAAQFAALRDAYRYAQAETVIRLEQLTPRMVEWIREEASRVEDHYEDPFDGGASWVETTYRIVDPLIDRLARRHVGSLVTLSDGLSDHQIASLVRYAREDQLRLCGRLARSLGLLSLSRAFESGARAASVMGNQSALRLLLVTS